jgi:hypothetical protein
MIFFIYSHIYLFLMEFMNAKAFAPALKGVKKINLLPLGFGVNKLI